MTHYIENELFKIGVKETGAELTSVYSKEKDFEYLWQGNADIWLGRVFLCNYLVANFDRLI